MNYRGKVVGITGADSFIGRNLANALNEAGAQVLVINGDTRERTTFRNVNYRMEYLFHFGSPSSQVLFKRQPGYAADVTINGFLNAARACLNSGVKLIYPSTGLLSHDRENEYARCKKLCEDIHLGENLDAIGIRIFASYGPGEDHKRDYASVPFLFARQMVAGEAPIIFGDGEQKRDFIFINDVIDGIMDITERRENGVYDLGSGVGTSFNDLVKLINKALRKKIEPIYIKKPGGYVDETCAESSAYTPKYSFEDGIAILVKELRRTYAKSNRNNNN